MSDQAKAVRVMNLQRFAEEGAADPIVIEGVGEFTPDELKELVSKGRDYTKKTQELATQRKQHESDLELIGKYGDFIRSLDADPEAQTEIANTISAINTRRESGQVATQSQINALQRQADETGSNELQEIAEDIKLDREIMQLQKKYDDFDEEAVMKYAQEHDETDLEKAYKLMNYENLASKSKQAQANKSVPRTQSGSGGSPPGTQTESPKTWKAARSAALEYMQSARE